MAQSNQFEFGIKGGANFSKYSGTLVVGDYNHKFGFYAGGFGNYSISDKLKIQPEVLFALQGSNFAFNDFRATPDSYPIDFKTAITETTISIPIVLQYYVVNRFYLEDGPQVGIILDIKEKLKSPSDDGDFGEIPIGDYDTFDFGLAAGLGYDLTENLSLNFRYFLGLIERDVIEMKSSVLNLGLEYKL